LLSNVAEGWLTGWLAVEDHVVYYYTRSFSIVESTQLYILDFAPMSY